MIFSNVKNRFCSRTYVANPIVHNNGEVRLRARMQRRMFRIHFLKAKLQYEIEPNRDLVLRDTKVLPDVRNRPL